VAEPANSPDENICISKSNYFSMISGIVIMIILTAVSFILTCSFYRRIYLLKDKQVFILPLKYLSKKYSSFQ